MLTVTTCREAAMERMKNAAEDRPGMFEASTISKAGAALWHADAPLTGAGLLLLAALLVSLAGLWADPRIITGAPAWLKPAKFAISLAIYSLTLAWIFTYLPGWTRVRRIAGWTTAVALPLEAVLISLQA